MTFERLMTDASLKSSAFTDPEIIDAIFLQYLGLQWKAHLKQACLLFFRQAWERNSISEAQETAITKIKTIDQSYDEDPSYPRSTRSINAIRERTYERVFFLSKLNEPENSNTYNDFVNMNETDARQWNPRLVAVKRMILHLMATEHRLNHLVHNSHAMIHSIMANFTPCLPHESILIVLAYLGVPQRWIMFFQTFLSAPMIFPGERTPRVCKRGAPVGYAFSVFFGEAIMFIMDVAVNQRTKGLRLYRIHDEMWLWDADVKKCLKAWRVMREYAAIVGMEFDEKMTGAAYSGLASADAPFLPKGEQKWGLLKFDCTTLKFIIDQNEVDLQIVEFRRRLAATKSVLGWVNIYNKYMAHLSRNLGGLPVNCLGNAFIDDLIKTFKRVQEELFRESNLGPINHLRNMIGERFGIHDLPDGYFYFSTAAGGLQLFNPILKLSAFDKSISPPTFNNFPVRPSGFMATTGTSVPDVGNVPIEMKLNSKFYGDLGDYQILKSRWEQQRVRWGPNGIEEFISFQEYVSLREIHLPTWGDAYDEMFNNPPAKEVAPVEVGIYPGCVHLPSKLGRERAMGVYAMWAESLYGEDVANRFGGFEIVDKTLILADVVDLFRTAEKKIN